MQTEKIIERTSSQDNASAKGVSSQQYMHTEQAAVSVPLLQALATGVTIGLAVFGLLMLWHVREAWLYGLVTWFLVQAVTWLALSTHWFVLTMAALEFLTKKDINGDGVIGMPGRGGAVKGRVVQVNLRTVQNNGHLSNVQYLRFPGDPEAMVMLATALLGGASLAERVWSGDGKLFSQKDYREIKKIMEEQLLIELKNVKDAKQGYVLTDKGVQTMEQIRETYSGNSPPPPDEDA